MSLKKRLSLFPLIAQTEAEMNRALYYDLREEAFTILRRLSSSVQQALGEYIVGFIVHGSLAGGDFAPRRSDVDLLVVTTAVLPPALLSQLTALHVDFRLAKTMAFIQYTLAHC